MKFWITFHTSTYKKNTNGQIKLILVHLNWEAKITIYYKQDESSLKMQRHAPHKAYDKKPHSNTIKCYVTVCVLDLPNTHRVQETAPAQ